VSEAAIDPAAQASGLDDVLGFRHGQIARDHAHASVEVSDRLKQPMGLVHGGVYAALAESVASRATALSVASDGLVAVGLSNQTSFVRPVVDGSIHAEGRCRHHGRTTWIWEIEMVDDRRRLCALSRVTVAVRPGPALDEVSPRSG